MKIANFNDFTNSIEGVFSEIEVKMYDKYKTELRQSSMICNMQKQDLKEEIDNLKSKIKKLRKEIKQAYHQQQKIVASIKIKKHQEAIKCQIQKQKQFDSATKFMQLSDESKAYACSSALLKKYLAREFTDNNPLDFEVLSNDVVFDCQKFEDSQMNEEARHIYDYVLSYIIDNPNRAKGPRYFIGKHKELKSWQELVDVSNKYFVQKNKDYKKEQTIEESRSGFEVVETYEDLSLQLVKLLTKEAVKYEGAAMAHCVGARGQSVESGNTQIYSIRDISLTEELKPYATIELKGGKIEELKGRANKAVAGEAKIQAARRAVLTLLNTERVENADFNDLSNIGYTKDVDMKWHDLYDLDSFIGCFFDTVKVNLDALCHPKFNQIAMKKLIVSDDVGGNISDLDLNINNKTEYLQIEIGGGFIKRMHLPQDNSVKNVEVNPIQSSAELVNISPLANQSTSDFTLQDLLSIHLCDENLEIIDATISLEEDFEVLDLSKFKNLQKLKLFTENKKLKKIIMPKGAHFKEIALNYSCSGAEIENVDEIVVDELRIQGNKALNNPLTKAKGIKKIAVRGTKNGEIIKECIDLSEHIESLSLSFHAKNLGELDLRKYKELKSLDICGLMSTKTDIIMPDNLEVFFAEYVSFHDAKMDFSNCRRLNKFTCDHYLFADGSIILPEHIKQEYEKNKPESKWDVVHIDRIEPDLPAEKLPARVQLQMAVKQKKAAMAR